MTLAVMAPAISVIEEIMAKRAERLDLAEITLISWWSDRAGTFKRELDYARKDGELALARTPPPPSCEGGIVNRNCCSMPPPALMFIRANAPTCSRLYHITRSMRPVQIEHNLLGSLETSAHPKTVHVLGAARNGTV